MIMHQFHPLAIVTLEVASAMTILGSLSGILPPLAALGAVLWYALQIWESDTVQSWVTKGKHVPRHKDRDEPPT